MSESLNPFDLTDEESQAAGDKHEDGPYDADQRWVGVPDLGKAAGDTTLTRTENYRIPAILFLLGLAGITWFVFGLWMLVGLLVYAFYGYKRSLLRHPDQPQWR